VIVLLLLVSLATASLLALHAYYSDASQRATAERVLRDYSSLVADEVIRRSAADIGYYGYYQLIGAVQREVQQGRRPSVANRAALVSPEDTRLKRAAGLAKDFFEMDPTTGGLTITSDVPIDEPGAGAWLRNNLPRIAAQHNEAGYEVLNARIANAPRTFVAAATRGPGGQARIAGFEVDLPALSQWFGTALNRQPLVPPSLGQGRVTNGFIYVSIRDQAGVERFRMGEEASANLVVTKPFGDAYQGCFSGFIVEASIQPNVAGQIVIGGLPRSRLPFYRGLLAFNALLIVTAILQLRREMALQKLRDEFVSSVSHELRTPLTQIRMFAETLLLDRIRSDDERRTSLEIIDREARRLTQLVENVLQFSRAERKVDTLAKEKRELTPLIQAIVTEFEAVVPAGQISFECRLRSGLMAKVDPDALRQVVINLLDNAVKYGGKSQRIIVGLEAREGAAVFFVDDEGPGIPSADRKRIFERFQRLERDRRSATAGTGIGLAVVRDLVIRHGGVCSVIAGERGGARFVVELPLSKAEEFAVQKQLEGAL
jgi:signal transduction histidine kinase